MKQKENCCPLIKIEDATPTTNSSTEESSHSNPHYVYIVVNGNTIDSVYTRKKKADDRRKYLIQQQVHQDETIDTNITTLVEVHKYQITHQDATQAAGKPAECGEGSERKKNPSGRNAGGRKTSRMWRG